MKVCIRLISLYIILFGFDSGGSLLKAQSFNYFERNMSENDKVIGFNLNQNFATNSLTSAFVIDFVNGKFISNEQKDKCIANFKNKEVLAGEQLNLSLNYQRRLIGTNNYLFLELGEALFYETKLHQDLFILLFKGNKVFENKIASLNPFQIKALEYFYFKGGFHRITDRYSIKLNLGYTGGQRFVDLKVNNGNLFTASEGKYIDLNLYLNSFDANPGKNSLFNISGNGFISDLILSYKPTNNSEIEAGLIGLGSIHWNKNVTERLVDTMYHFDGAEISNVLDSFSIAIKNVEELKSSFIKERANVKYKTNLPYKAYIQYSQFLIPDVLQIQLRYGIINSELTKPFINSAANLYLSANKLIGINLDAGGYGKLNIGAQFAICFSNKSSIHLYFNSISNLIMPANEMNFTGGMVYRKALH